KCFTIITDSGRHLDGSCRRTHCDGQFGHDAALRRTRNCCSGGMPSPQRVSPAFLPGVSATLPSYECALDPSAKLTTISDRVLLTIAFSSACSSVGTLNLSRVC